MRKKTKTSLPQTLDERLALIDRLREKKAEIEKQLNELTGLKQEEVKPAPIGFDYKDAIYEVFEKNPGKVLGIDEVVQQLAVKHDFTPDRHFVVRQTMFLVDRHKKIKRVEGRRGRYQLNNPMREINAEHDVEE